MHSPGEAVISLYARGRDYHKVVRARLQRLALKVQDFLGPMGHRAFCDSAPVLEVEMAQRSGVGWRGKHTLALHREAGSLFFLGELFVDVALPPSEPVSAHCGSCTACLEACPTRAIVAPYRLDARRCISYLTIEHDGVIDPELRPLMGNRIYGCDDCQWVCPWNKYAQRSTLPDFLPRDGLQGEGLRTLWAWDEAEFFRRTQGTAIRRIGWVRWRRNLAIGLGNALRECKDASEAQNYRKVLQDARPGSDPLVQTHIDWALTQGCGEGRMA
jgi:epoxyqueuosine reductase